MASNPLKFKLCKKHAHALNLILFRCLTSNRPRKKKSLSQFEKPSSNKRSGQKAIWTALPLRRLGFFFSALKLQWSITFTLLADMSVCLVNLNRYQHSIWVLMWSISSSISWLLADKWSDLSQAVAKSEQIQKMATIFTQNDNFWS